MHLQGHKCVEAAFYGKLGLFVMRVKLGFLLWLLALGGWAQPITGVWRGKLQTGGMLLQATYKLELKLVKKGDSLIGTSYYYANANNYYRYLVRGYFDDRENAVHWWDDVLLDSKTSGGAIALGFLKKTPLEASADFNCPGSGIMRLDGKAEAENGTDFELHLSKTEGSQFADEWDAVIDGYFYGMADPAIIDSVAAIAAGSKVAVPTVGQEPPIAKAVPTPPKPQPTAAKPPLPKPAASQVPQPARPEKPPPADTTPTITAKFSARQKLVATTIPIGADSVVLQFYDNAEVDGDSIALFLNGHLLFEHIRLTGQAYSITIAASQLTQEQNELTMVAENLGSIPPNTSFMVAYAGGKRFTANLESTAYSSAVIRLVRPASTASGQQ
ncbi:MAG: hypothetical protein EAY75_04020 [Bacteroidetes bacterium]|nr:MAG: hypothetical protein EAY75_04020 [Bacteroidota bacterium]